MIVCVHACFKHDVSLSPSLSLSLSLSLSSLSPSFVLVISRTPSLLPSAYMSALLGLPLINQAPRLILTLYRLRAHR